MRKKKKKNGVKGGKGHEDTVGMGLFADYLHRDLALR
jgi:hypothetical protein